MRIFRTGGPALLAALAVLSWGCGLADNKGAGGKDQPTRVAAAKDAKGHDHSGWWCDEHGVPEAVCGQCSAKVAKELKAKGDWCKEHDRPESQCFLCHPELKEKFAALYRAKYGQEPPPTEDEAKAKKEGDKPGSDGKE